MKNGRRIDASCCIMNQAAATAMIARATVVKVAMVDGSAPADNWGSEDGGSRSDGWAIGRIHHATTSTEPVREPWNMVAKLVHRPPNL